MADAVREIMSRLGRWILVLSALNPVDLLLYVVTLFLLLHVVDLILLIFVDLILLLNVVGLLFLHGVKEISQVINIEAWVRYTESGLILPF